ncbi:MAG: hypothetical protein ACREDF_09570 [Thermoplasmata archaeon]
MIRKNIFVWNNPRRRLLTRDEVEVAVWEERDRLHIHIRDKKTQQRTIAEWWDDDARQMFEDGFFKPGVELKRSVIRYAEEVGLLAKENARRNIFAWNNPGKEQAWLAEQFVKGANSGVAGSIYVHGSTIYSYGPHFPIAKRADDIVYITDKKPPSRTTAGHIGLVKRAAEVAGKKVIYLTFPIEAAGPAGYSNPLTRRESSKEIREIRSAMSKGADFQRMGRDPDWQFGYAHGVAGVVHRHGPKSAQRVAERAVRHLRYNPASEGGRGNLEDFARSIGLYLATWAPGDGMKRYRFFTKPSSYDEGGGIYTALGLKEAWCFVRGYAASKTGAKGNPVSDDAQSFISGKIGTLVREGYPQKQAIAIAYSMARKAGYRVPARANCCSNPLSVTHKAGHAAPPGQILGDFQRGVIWGALQDVLSWGAVRIDGQQYIIKGDRYWASSTSSYRMQDALKKLIGRNVVAGVISGATHGWEIYGRRSIRLMRPTDHPETPEGLALLAAEFHPKAGPATRANPLTVAESREIAESAHTEAVRAAGMKPGEARGFRAGRADGMTDVVRGYGPEFARSNGSARIFKVPSGLEEKVASMLRNAFIWAQARDGEVLTLARPEIVKRAIAYVKKHPSGDVRPNPLLQTVMLANPPISKVWDTLTHRRRHAALEFAGFPDDYARVLARSAWNVLDAGAKRALQRQWAANPLTRKEAGSLLHVARSSAAKSKSPTLTKSGRSYQRGFATGLTAAVGRFGPKGARRAVDKLYHRTSVLKNPTSVRIPFREGQKIPIERARAWVRKLGNPELMRQFEDAERLQAKANRKPRFVIWRTLPIGSAKKIEMLTAFAHYGDSPETMYKPPEGSKKGRSLYRHSWGDGSGRPRPVPVLAAPGGKAIIKVMGPGQKTGDWMRG